MYYLVDEPTIKAYYFNRLSRGELYDPEYFYLKNVAYHFDQEFQMTKISVVDQTNPAYILTTNGFVEWKPPYRVTIFDLSYPLSFVKPGNYDLFPIDYSYSGSASPICLSYVCWKMTPTNPIQLSKDDFKCYPETKIEENENKLIFHLNKPNRCVIGISLNEKAVDMIYIYNPAVKILVLTKGTCFFVEEENKTVCY